MVSADPDFAIAPATWRDFRELLALERRCFARDPWPWMDVLAALTFPDTVRFKAIGREGVNGGGPVGFVIGDRRASQRVGWIASIGVDPDYQRRGLGWRLLLACERALNMPCLRLTLRPSNQGARALYDRAGYVEIDRLPGYYLDGEDGIVMEKLVGSSG
jgi:ribosomal protein S18 acetylase RimI-like enzyme